MSERRLERLEGTECRSSCPFKIADGQVGFTEASGSKSSVLFAASHRHDIGPYR